MNDIGPPYVGRSLLRREDRRLLTGARPVHRRSRLAAHAARGRSCAARWRMPASARSICRAPRRCRASCFALNGADLLQLLPPVPEGQISMPSKWTTVIQHKFLNPQEPLLAHDKVRHVGEAIAIIVAETRDQAEDAAELVSLRPRRAAGGRRPRGGAAPRQPDRPRAVRHQPDRRVLGRPGRRRGGVRRGAASPEAPLLPSPLRRGADGVPRRRRRLRSAHRLGDDLVLDPGRALGAARGRGTARPARGAGALHRARCRRRLWRQGPCLPRGPADHVSRAPARPAGALDRGAARAYDERDPFARPTARCRGRL